MAITLQLGYLRYRPPFLLLWVLLLSLRNNDSTTTTMVTGFVPVVRHRVNRPSTNGDHLRKVERIPRRPTSLPYIKGVELSDLVYDSTSTAFDAWEWTANLGAPAALVAGAVLVTLGETREKFGPRRGDKKWVRIAKQVTRFLLLSSFALEVISIFVSTMSGSVLLSHPEVVDPKKAIGYGSPLALLHHHHEFEYLTIELGFLQGLIHWLGAAALEVLIPQDNETYSARRMNRFMASCLVTLIFWILAFYNHHLSFYSDYLEMVRRYIYLFFIRYFVQFRPMSFLYGPWSIFTGYLGWKAFWSKPDLDDD